MHRNQTVDTHRFSMIPRAEIPRASFTIESTHKTTFDAGLLIPIYTDEVLPGDTFNLSATIFARLSTPLFPMMDNLHLSTFWFFVPNRLVWTDWVHMMGEQENPGDSTDFTIPQCFNPLGGWPANTIGDYMGLPVAGQIQPADQVYTSALWLRAYNLIWNEWFRDENLQDKVQVSKGPGPDNHNLYTLLRRGKRHDYFTSCLPWPQKGPSVPLALNGTAPVVTDLAIGGTGTPSWKDPLDAGTAQPLRMVSADNQAYWGGPADASGNVQWSNPALVADLGAATAATINQIRQSFQLQKLLERDARGGTRYTEQVRAHFGVNSPDARLQRPEYLGGGTTPIAINPVAQTSGTPPAAGGYTDTPLANLAAIGTALHAGHGFTSSFVEHGMIIGLACVTADLTYQQGLRKMYSRKTRFDYYYPAFAMLGEQAVLNKELYITGTPTGADSANDSAVFGYQERWAEYRYKPSEISGLFRSTSTGTIDPWHLAQNFTALPTLNTTFISENPPIDRILAVGAAAGGQQLIADCFFRVHAARPLPLYSIPGLIDHF